MEFGLSQERYEPHQTELLEWFERNAPALGRLYKGAIIMVNDQSFPGRIRFVSHAVREIANSLLQAEGQTTVPDQRGIQEKTAKELRLRD